MTILWIEKLHKITFLKKISKLVHFAFLDYARFVTKGLKSVFDKKVFGVFLQLWGIFCDNITNSLHNQLLLKTIIFSKSILNGVFFFFVHEMYPNSKRAVTFFLSLCWIHWGELLSSAWDKTVLVRIFLITGEKNFRGAPLKYSIFHLWIVFAFFHLWTDFSFSSLRTFFLIYPCFIHASNRSPMDKGLHNTHKTVGVYSSMEGDNWNFILLLRCNSHKEKNWLHQRRNSTKSLLYF